MTLDNERTRTLYLMTVYELIDRLRSFPGDTDVAIAAGGSLIALHRVAMIKDPDGGDDFVILE